jgi:transcriptional regulator with XRE-family HTH domain
MNHALRDERLRRGWTQTWLAGVTGIASPDLSAVEHGRKPAFPAWRRKLSQVFGLPEHVLFPEPSEPTGTEATR